MRPGYPWVGNPLIPDPIDGSGGEGKESFSLACGRPYTIRRYRCHRRLGDRNLLHLLPRRHQRLHVGDRYHGLEGDDHPRDRYRAHLRSCGSWRS